MLSVFISYNHFNGLLVQKYKYLSIIENQSQISNKLHLKQLRLFNKLWLQPMLFVPCAQNQRKSGTKVFAKSSGTYFGYAGCGPWSPFQHKSVPLAVSAIQDW